jgi:hypothetical protein
MGAHDIFASGETGSYSLSPSKIIIHPEWNPNTPSHDADIAMFITEDEIPFTRFIRPICIHSEELDVLEGWTAGWGRSEDSEIENTPKEIQVPILQDSLDCVVGNTDLFRVASKRTICGGAKDLKGPCNGDSGGGLYVKQGGAFYLKGLVSASATDGFKDCKLSNYVIYTDIHPFINWIKNPYGDVSSEFKVRKNFKNNCVFL